MKQLLSSMLLSFALMPGSAFANTIIGFSPNDGSGDNFGFLIQGVGFTIDGGAGTPFSFFNFLGYAPGSTLGGVTDIISGGGIVMFGRTIYNVFFSTGTLFLSSITLPTNGKDFTAYVEIDFGISGIITDTGQTINAAGGAKGTIKFDYFDGFYYPESFVQAPEPSTLALVGTGLILATTRNRQCMSQRFRRR